MTTAVCVSESSMPLPLRFKVTVAAVNISAVVAMNRYSAARCSRRADLAELVSAPISAAISAEQASQRCQRKQPHGTVGDRRIDVGEPGKAGTENRQIQARQGSRRAPQGLQGTAVRPDF